MSDYGLLPTGFAPQTTPIIREEINNEIRGEFGASLDVSDYSLLGFIIGIVAERLGKLWELAEAVYSSQDPDKAAGAALDALCALTGTFRQSATPSTVTLTLTGTPTTLVSAGNRASAASTEAEFSTDEDATIALLDSWTINTAYAVGDRVTASSRAYQCITAGTSVNIGFHPGTTDADIEDNTVHWTYLGEGTGAVDVAATCTTNGPSVAVARDITVRETPVTGWSSVINLEDADLGTDLGTDEATRLQREIDLATPGTSTADAIRQALLAVEDVDTVKLFVNNTDAPDADGVPAHAIEAVIQGGTDQDIWDCLLANVAAGVATHGTEDGTALDSEGNSHDVSFSRPDPVNIYLELDVEYDAATFPSDGEDQIKDAIVAWGNARGLGLNAVASGCSAQAFRVTGVLDVTDAKVGTVDPPASSSVSIDSRQLAVYATSRIAINLTPGTP